MTTVTATGHEVRPATEADWPAVLDVIDADRLPGQPPVTAEMLGEAVRGRSPIDGGFWDELSGIAVDVLTDSEQGVLGVVAYAHRPRDRVGVILWLHGHEDPGVMSELVEHALAQLADCPVVEAFAFATALGVGLEALPVRHRSATDKALRAVGFVGEDLWRYMHRHLPAPELPHAAAFETSAPEERTRQLSIREHGQLCAEATIGLPVAGVGVLWWISVEPDARGRGLGRALLGSALDLLAGLGAAEVILYVDDDDTDPASDRNRSAANTLYDTSGFTEIDRLHSYQLTR